jgi:predicted 2-oxoglutarate/Fe(II)-dependent dioxygenase YbiX
MDFPAPLLVLDDFFTKGDADACLQECIDLKPVYQPARVGAGKDNRRDTKIRRNDVVMMDTVFSPDRTRSVILSALDRRVQEQDCKDLWHAGYTLFDTINYANWKETVLSRYGRCDFYGRHQDTIFNADERGRCERRRMVTMVVYLNTEPESFTGGALSLYDSDREITLTPRHNRAVVFPSFCWHSVGNVDLPEDRPWSGGRFSINHWLGFQ